MSNLMDSVAASLTTSAEDETRAIGGRVRPANENELAVEDVDAAVLDVGEVARLLRVGRNTIYELVGRNEIPHRRLRKQIRFSRAVILRWLDGNDASP